MTFTIPVALTGADAAGSAIDSLERGLGKVTDSAGRARDAMGRFVTAGTQGGAAVAKGADAAAAGHGRAREAVEGHGDALTKLIHLAEAYIAVHQIEGIVDGYIEIRNKTNSVADSAANLNGLMAEQFRIAQETRSSWEDLAGTFQRISNASRGLGLSQREVLDLTEELAMGMRLSGSSSREAAMTMMELTHAFTVGALTGREFKVMMKDAPALMHELQVVSGKTGAEFAEMGKHGKFSAQQLIEWFDKAKDTIRDKFGQTIPTIGEGFVLIRNAAVKFFGEAGLGSGVLQSLGSAMKFVADHMDAFAGTLLAVAEALLSLLIIEKVIALVKALTIALAENPLTAILVALTVGISLLRQFGDELQTNQKIWSNVEGQFVTVGDQLFAVWEMMKKLAAAVLDFVENAWKKLTSAFDAGIDGSGIEFSLRNVLLFVASFVDAGIGIFKMFRDTVVNVFGGIPVMLTELFVVMAKGVARVVQDLVNGLIDSINAVIKSYNYVKGLVPGGSGVTMGPDEQRRAAEKWAADMNAKYGFNTSAGYGSGENAAAMVRAHQAGLKPTWVGFSSGMAPGGPGGYEPANLIGHINTDFQTPYDGAAKAWLQKIEEDWNNDIKNTNVTKDLVNSFMDSVDKIARDHAAQRVMETKASTVGTTHGTPDARPIDEKEAKALEKLKNELRAVTEASNPQAEAIEKLSHAHQIFEKAVQHNLITQDEAQRRYDQYRAKLEDQLHPFDAWIRKQQEATAALRDNTEEQERASEMQKFLTELKKQQGGTAATATEVAIAERQIAADQHRVELMRAEQQVTQSILGPQRTYQTQLEALGDLLERGRITSEQYGRSVDEVRAAFLAATPAAKTLAGGLEIAWLKAKSDADAFGATLANTIVGDVDKLNDAIITMANNGEVSWSKMIDAMIQDLERLILKQLEVAAINALITAATGGTPVPGAGQAIVGSGAVPTPDPGIPRIASSGYPTAYPATAGAATAASASTAAQQAPVIHIHNHYDEDVAIAAIKSPAGQQVVLNTLRANGVAVRR